MREVLYSSWYSVVPQVFHGVCSFPVKDRSVLVGVVATDVFLFFSVVAEDIKQGHVWCVFMAWFHFGQHCTGLYAHAGIGLDLLGKFQVSRDS